MEEDLQVIGETACFYGALTGLLIGPGSGSETARRLFATFEANGDVALWVVPDRQLFSALADRLAMEAFGEPSGVESSLRIDRAGGVWQVGSRFSQAPAY